MSVQTKTQLNTTIDTDITTNGSNDITGAQVNSILSNMVDSYEDIMQSYTYANMLAIASPATYQKVIVTDFSSAPTIFIYTGTYWKPICGCVVIYVSTTAVGTDAATTEKTLASYTLPASYLNQNFDYIEVQAWGTYAANANTKLLRLKFGSTTFATTALAQNNQTWIIRSKILRTAAATQDMFTELNILTLASVGNGTVGCGEFQQPTETLSGTVAITVTGQNGTANANDIILKGMSVTLHRK